MVLDASSIRLRHSPDGISWAPLDVELDVPAAPTNFRATNMGTTWNSISLAWNAAPDAVSYNVYTGSTFTKNTTGTTHTATLTADAKYSFYVESVNAQGVVSSSWAGPVNVKAGHAQVTKSGSFNWEGRPAATATFRPIDGWGYNADDVVQGYYTTASYTGYGTMSYDGAGFRNWVTSNYGSDVISKMTFNSLSIYVYRNSSSGQGNYAVSQTYYVSSAWAGSGGQPSLAGGSAMGSHAYGQASWDSGIPPHWAGHVLRNENVSGTGVCQSFVIHRHNSTDYSKYEGKNSHGSAFNLKVNCSWDFVASGQVNTAPW